MDKQRLERPSQQGGSRGSPQGRGLGARRPAWGRETWVWSSGLGARSLFVCRLPAPRCPWAASSSSEERWTMEDWVSNAATALERELLRVGKQRPALPLTGL